MMQLGTEGVGNPIGLIRPREKPLFQEIPSWRHIAGMTLSATGIADV